MEALARAGAVAERLGLDLREKTLDLPKGYVLRARACRCDEPREFRLGECHRCGRWLVHELLRPYDMTDLSGYARLEEAVMDERLKLMQEAGPERRADPERYKAWLESRLRVAEMSS